MTHLTVSLGHVRVHSPVFCFLLENRLGKSSLKHVGVLSFHACRSFSPSWVNFELHLLLLALRVLPGTRVHSHLTRKTYVSVPGIRNEFVCGLTGAKKLRTRDILVTQSFPVVDYCCAYVLVFPYSTILYRLLLSQHRHSSTSYRRQEMVLTELLYVQQ